MTPPLIPFSAALFCFEVAVCIALALAVVIALSNARVWIEDALERKRQNRRIRLTMIRLSGGDGDLIYLLERKTK